MTWPVTLWTAILVPAYWVGYGPANFLWFSDIALFAAVLSLWTGWRLPYSMMAVGVLPLELAWVADFAAGGWLTGTTAYMFDASLPLHLRVLSLFHLFLPPLILWMLVRQGYDPRAARAQTALVLVVLPLTYALTGPEENINLVYGPLGPQDVLPPLLYLALYMLALPLLVILPMHLLLRRLFG
ncbi:hypothetical protein [Crenalkalicoccus roseus]|uniref:hypothetical protein n=1 Tax=Crenalkalicoccus roseus TaxID=1485588 RepID=UPI00195B58C4|nr:hypothetical protein [Crenalkalicoccus roseus]